MVFFFFFSSRRRHTRYWRDWSSDVCSSDLLVGGQDELVFDGASCVVTAEGEVVARAPQFEEATLVVDVEMAPVYRKRLLDPRGRAQSEPLPIIPVSQEPRERPPLTD